MATQAEKEQIANFYMDRLTAELLHAESDLDGTQVKVLQREQTPLWIETRGRVQRALETELKNGTLDDSVEQGTLVIDGVTIPALPKP